MPVTETPFPILIHFLCAVVNVTGMPLQPLDATPEQASRAEKAGDEDTTAKKLPKGVVLGPDGKP